MRFNVISHYFAEQEFTVLASIGARSLTIVVMATKSFSIKSLVFGQLDNVSCL